MIDDIKSIDGYESMTTQEIADELNANPLHQRDAFITGGPANTASINLLHLLVGKFRVLQQDRNQSWIGPLDDLAQQSSAVNDVMNTLRPYLQVKDSEVYCGQVTEAADMVNGIVAAVGSILEANQAGTTQDVADAVALLTGGRKFGSVTAVEVTEAIARDSIEPQWQAKRAVVEEGIFDGSITTLQQIADAITGGE
jgi:hypothetical protein